MCRSKTIAEHSKHTTRSQLLHRTACATLGKTLFFFSFPSQSFICFPLQKPCRFVFLSSFFVCILLSLTNRNGNDPRKLGISVGRPGRCNAKLLHHRECASSQCPRPERSERREQVKVQNSETTAPSGDRDHNLTRSMEKFRNPTLPEAEHNGLSWGV